MATHFVNSQTNLYRYFTPTSDVLVTLQQQEQITVLEENVGFDCSFYKVKYNDLEGYIESFKVERLPEIPESAPFVCSVLSVPQGSYVEPEWQMLADKSVFYNEKTNEYSVVVLIDNLFFNDRNSTDAFAKNKGLKALLEFYNKQRDEQTLQTLLSYFILCEVKDLYIPFRPRTRAKALVVVKKRYFDAIPVSTQQEIEDVDISKANFIVRFNAKEIQTLFKGVENNLKSYDDDIYLSNSKLQIKLGTDETGFSNTSTKLRETLSLKDKAQKVSKFYDKLSDLLAKNGFTITQNKSSQDQIFIELAINDKCNVVYDIAYNKNNVCTKLRTGTSVFLKSDPIDDPTIVSFVKNADRISKIEKCNVPWVEFVETYVYPEVILQNISVNDIVQNFEKNKYEYARDLQQIFKSLQYESDLSTAKTAKQVFEQEITLAGLKDVNVWKQFKDDFDKHPFSRTLFVGDNFFNPSNINQTLANIEASLGEKDPTKVSKIVAYDIATDSFRVVEEIDTTKEDPIALYGEAVEFRFSDTDTFEYPKQNENKLQPYNKLSPYYILWTGASAIIQPVYKTPKTEIASEIDRNEFFLIKIYDLLNKVGLCKIIDFTSNCLISLVRDFADIDFDATLAVGQISSLNSKELQEEAIPYLPKEQQQLVYNQLLLKLPCLTSASLLYILKRALPPEEYAALNLEQATYDNIAAEVASLMSTSTK